MRENRMGARGVSSEPAQLHFMTELFFSLAVAKLTETLSAYKRGGS
jgi:hypothetical protein